MFLLQLLQLFSENIGQTSQCFLFKYFKTTRKQCNFFGSIFLETRKRISSSISYQTSSIFISYTSSCVKMDVEYRCTDISGIIQNIFVQKCVVSSSFNMWYSKTFAIKLQRVEFTCHVSSIFVAHSTIWSSIKIFLISSIFLCMFRWLLK